jgi:predicted transposase YdaD
MQNPSLQAQEILSAEFQWVSQEGDVLIRVQDPLGEDFLIANEIQLRYSPKMPRRMRAYAALAEEKFQMPVYPVLVIILPALDTEIVKGYESEIQGIQVKQDYRVIQLSEVEASLVFQKPLPTLLPFVPIMKGGGESDVIREALTTLQKDPDLSELESLLAFRAIGALRDC